MATPRRKAPVKIKAPETPDVLDAVKADFRNFLFLVWEHLSLPAPTEIQYDIAKWLQTGPRRMIIEAFRGVGKSWITAAFVLWLLLRNPEERILVVSASKDRADAFSTFTKRLIDEMPILHHLRPNPEKGHRDSNLAFDVGPSSAHQAPSVRSVGITGQLTGGRATVIIADDVEIPKNSLTTLMRQRLAELVKEFDAVLTPGGRVIYLGTPQTEMSLYNSLTTRGYEMRVWPARFPKEKLQRHYGSSLAPSIARKLADDPTLPLQFGERGAPTDPHRFTDKDLLEREASYGRSGFALQFMLDTTMSDANKFPLKLSDLIIMDVSADLAPVTVAWGSGPEQIINDIPNLGLTGDRYHRPMFVHKDFIPYQGKALIIDPSGRGSDETGYAVVNMLNGYLFCPEMGGLIGGYDDYTLETLASIAKRNKVNVIYIESNFGDGMFAKLLTPWLMKAGYPCTIEEDHSSVQKEKRIIDTLEPVMNQHRLVVSPKVIQHDMESIEQYAGESAHQYSLAYQLTRITREKGALRKDDRLDALAMGVAYWVEVMDKDVNKVAEQHKEESINRALQDFENHVFGHTPKNLSWSASWD